MISDKENSKQSGGEPTPLLLFHHLVLIAGSHRPQWLFHHDWDAHYYFSLIFDAPTGEVDEDFWFAVHCWTVIG